LICENEEFLGMNKPTPLTEEDRINLVAYLDGELEPSATSALEAKLSLSTPAREEAESLRRTWSLLDYLPRPELSPQFTHQTLERLAAITPSTTALRRRWRAWVVGTGWAAALVAAATVGFAGGIVLHRQVPAAPELPLDVDGALVRDLGVLENKRLYDNVESIDFLRALANAADPDLFADENWDS
jgi:anti-sigma factor RsiW